MLGVLESAADKINDRALLALWRDGDKGAGSQLVRRHFDAVARFFERRIDRSHLQELVQDTFVAAVESRTKFPDDIVFRAYLLGIARNKLLMHLRTKRRRGDDLELPDDHPAGSTLRPSGFAAAREEQIVLSNALRTLDLDLQIALELFYWEDMGTADIAAALGVPRGTVKTRLARARTKLKKAIRQEASTLALADSTVGNLDRWARSIRGKYDS